MLNSKRRISLWEVIAYLSPYWQAWQVLVIGSLATIASQSMEADTQLKDVRTVISPEEYPYFGFPYSPGIMVGNTLYVAGHLGRDPVHDRAGRGRLGSRDAAGDGEHSRSSEGSRYGI